MPNPLVDREQPTYVLDFISTLRYIGENGQPVENFIVHELENGRRAVNMARLIRRVFVPRDGGQAPMLQPVAANPAPAARRGAAVPMAAFEAFKAYDNVEAIKAACPGIKVIPYTGVIPSLNKIAAQLQEEGIRPDNGKAYDDPQSYNIALYKKARNFLTRIIPPEIVQIQNPDGPQAA